MVKQQTINIGKISGVFGVKGWVKVFSFTDPRENILTYTPWLVIRGNEVKKLHIVAGKSQGKTIVAQLEGINSREDAQLLNGWDISIDKSQLRAISADEYYWADLIGLQVATNTGLNLGVVDHLMETGANDVLVVKGDRERLIPFLQGQTVLQIDLDARQMVVDWDPDF